MIKQLHQKIIYTSIDKSQLPSNLDQYKCDLVQVQNLKTNTTKKYLQFHHKRGNQQSFKVKLVSFKRPSVLMHVYKLQADGNKIKNEQKSSYAFNLKGKIDYIAEPIVQRKKKQFIIKEDMQESEDQYTEKKIILHDDQESSNSDSSSDGSESSSKGMAPSKQNQGKVKLAVIQILQKNQKIGSIKQVNKRLKQDYKIKVPEKTIKDILVKVCIQGQKKGKSYVLKSQHAIIPQDQVKKKVKQD